MTDMVSASAPEVPVELRDARRDDLPFLRAMCHAAVFGAAGQNLPEDAVPSIEAAMTDHGLGQYVEGWGREGDYGIIAELGGEEIGAAWYRKYDRSDGLPPYELSGALKEGYRGRRIGPMLLEGLISRAAANGISEIGLQAHRDNQPGLKLYRKFGFQPIRDEDANGYTFMAASTGASGSKPAEAEPKPAKTVPPRDPGESLVDYETRIRFGR